MKHICLAEWSAAGRIVRLARNPVDVVEMKASLGDLTEKSVYGALHRLVKLGYARQVVELTPKGLEALSVLVKETERVDQQPITDAVAAIEVSAANFQGVRWP